MNISLARLHVPSSCLLSNDYNNYNQMLYHEMPDFTARSADHSRDLEFVEPIESGAFTSARLLATKALHTLGTQLYVIVTI